MPEKTINRLVPSLQQNNGQLSKRARARESTAPAHGTKRNGWKTVRAVPRQRR